MRFVRRASLVFSLVLIVAITVGYVARTSQLTGDRDLRLSAAAELGSAHLSSIVESTTVVARLASDTPSAGPAAAIDPSSIAAAMASVHRNFGVCVVSAEAQTCRGDGPAPDIAQLESEQQRRQAADRDELSSGTIVSLYDSVMTIKAAGPDATVFVTGTAEISGVRSEFSIKATTLLPAEGQVGGFTVDRGRRQTSTPVEGAVDVYVVAEGDDAVSLPPEEYRFYLIIFTLAVVLLLLAGMTLFMEQRSLHERASFDSLTKLPNRGEFERRAAEVLAHAERTETGACLLLFDLNGFKQVNDTHGHHAGDEILKVVGSRLRKAVRDGDVVARWGGDEFVVLMPGIDTDEMGSRRALQLADQVSGRTRIEGVAQPLRVKVSVGVAVWPDHDEALSDLVVAADHAMYEAKREGVTCRVAAPRPSQPELVHTHV